MHKFLNFLLNLGNSFTGAYLLLIIYNRFIADYFQLEKITYWYVFFISMFVGLIINNESTYKALKYLQLEKDVEDLDNTKTSLEIAKFLVFIITILIIKFLF